MKLIYEQHANSQLYSKCCNLYKVKIKKVDDFDDYTTKLKIAKSSNECEFTCQVSQYILVLSENLSCFRYTIFNGIVFVFAIYNG